MTALRRSVVVVLAVAAPVLVWLTQVAYADITPDPMPSHWGTSGVDGTTAAHTYYLIILIAAGVLAAATLATSWWAHSTHAGRMLAAMLSFGSWIAAVPYLETMLLARHITDPYQVPMPWYAVLGGAGVPIIIAAGVYAVHGPRRDTPPRRTGAPAMTIGKTERVTWIGHAHSMPLRIVAPVLMVAAAVAVFFQVQVAIPLGIGGLALAWTSVLAVRVDNRGVHTLWGPFGWPRPRIAPDNIAAVRVEDIHPMQWGGWGYRHSARGIAAVVRGGPGLVIERVHGPTYAVTVDDPDEAAQTLNAILGQSPTR